MPRQTNSARRKGNCKVRNGNRHLNGREASISLCLLVHTPYSLLLAISKRKEHPRGKTEGLNTGELACVSDCSAHAMSLRLTSIPSPPCCRQCLCSPLR